MLILVITGTRKHTLKVAAAVGETLGVFRDRMDVMLVVGDQRGVDQIAADLAHQYGWLVVMCFYVKALGRKGGPVRNAGIAEVAAGLREIGHDVFCFAIPSPESTGTWDCYRKLKAKAFDVEVVRAGSNGSGD